MTVRLIVSDLDGTLLGADGQLSRATIDAIRRVRASGITFLAATGRAPRSAIERVGGRGLLDALVCSNGSIVHDPETDRNVRRRTIDPGHVADVIASLDTAFDDLSYAWELPDRYAWDTAFHPIATEHDDMFMFEPGERPNGADRITKLLVSHPELLRTELRDALLPHLPHPLSVGCSGVTFVELTGPDVNKATTIAQLASELGVTAEETIAFGDNANDLEMLAWAGTGIAMGNAHDETKAAADEVIGHHADDAVADYLLSLVST
ncbi:MAG: HAD family hydrolase [Actinomycetota bacterium]